MQYNEIYNICQPVMDWLKEQYPNNHKIVIDTTGVELIECGKLIAIDKKLKGIIDNKKSSVETIEENRKLFSSDEDYERAKKEAVAIENGLNFLFDNINKGKREKEHD